MGKPCINIIKIVSKSIENEVQIVSSENSKFLVDPDFWAFQRNMYELMVNGLHTYLLQKET